MVRIHGLENQIHWILLLVLHLAVLGFPGASAVKNLPAMQETQESGVQCLGGEDSPGGRHGNPLLYSCLENPMDRGAWWAI